MKTKKLGKRILAVALSAMMVAGLVPATALAAAPTVEVDEAVYINLDYYGGVDEVEIVKGCVLNGNTKIVDYGNYTEIVNMTNSIQPVVKGDEVTWDISGTDAETFYFEAKADSIDMTLPWTIDVSYKLNGKPARGEDLAGASGLVSTIITATPNKNAPDYYKNNMVLAVASLADMDSKTYSLTAPGAQTQSLGTKKVVFFLALPGEEATFQIDLGTSEYESMGTFIMMVPATLDSLGMISDVREVKDKVKDSLDLMSDSADVIFDNLSNMRTGLEETRKGLEAAQKAKAQADANKDQVKADVDAAINSLDSITSNLIFLSNQAAIEQVDFNKAMDRLEGLRGTIYSMQYYTKETRDDIDELNDRIDDLKKMSKEESGNAKKELKELEALLKATKGDLLMNSAGMSADAQNQLFIKYLGELAFDPSSPTDAEKAAAKNKVAADMAKKLDISIDEADLLVDASLAGTSANLLGESVRDMNGAMTLAGDVDDMLGVLESILVQYDAFSTESNKEYRTNLNNLIDMLEEFTLNASASVQASQTALRSVRNIMDITDGAVSSAIDSSLNGMIDIIGSTIGITDGTETFRKAKDTMKDAIDNEIDDLEADSNILNLDINQDFPSFTSAKNASPASIQIVMRTKEITIDDLDEVDNAVDIEPPKEDLGVWGRIKAVFLRIIRFFTGEKEAEQPSAIETQKEVYENAKAGNQNKGTDAQSDASDSIIAGIKTDK